MMSRLFSLGLPLSLLSWLAVPAQERSPSSPPSEIFVNIYDRAKPLEVALTLAPGTPGDAELAAEISRVLGDDIAFESVFRIVDSRLYPEIGTGDRATGGFPYAAWKSAGLDVVIEGTISQDASGILVPVRMYAVGASEMVFGTAYRSTGSGRRLAHRIADDILEKFGVSGVAESRIAFASDRDRNRQSGRGDTHLKAIYVMDYDGARPERFTDGFLDLAPRWSPDGRSLMFVSFPTRLLPPELDVLELDRPRRTLVSGEAMVFPGSWSPDGSRIAFSSTRDGNAEIYVVNADGTGLRRLTDHPGIDVSPTWSPTGRELAFVSNRTGSPQIYTMDGDGLNVTRISTVGTYNAEPSWSPSREFSEIAWSSRVEGAEGAVFDIVVIDLLTRQVRQLTNEHGLNESPSWALNGRHLAFSSTRTGDSQIFTIDRNGANLRQLTSEGGNTTPSWSR